MKKPKDISVELLKNNSIRLSLTENVTHYPIKERYLEFPIQQKDLLACYAILQTDKEGVEVILEAIDDNLPLPYPMRDIKFNQHESVNPIWHFKDVVYTLGYFKTQITNLIQEHEEGFEVQQMAIV